MSTCKIENIVKITTGAYKKFTVTLTDEDTGERIDLTNSSAGKILFKTGAGAIVEKAIALPPTDPKLGVIEIELTGAESATLDKDTKSFEIEYQESGNTVIHLGENLLEVKERLSV